MTVKTATPKTLQLVIQEDGDQVAIRWEEPIDGSEDRAVIGQYAIALDDLEECAQKLHKCLAALESVDWDEKDLDVERVPCLKNLVRAGTRLYEILMTGDPSSGDPEDDRSMQRAATFRAWFEDTVLSDDDEWRIQVIHKQYDAPVVPWGLVFTPKPDGDDHVLDGEWDSYRNFWAHSFKLGCRGILSRKADRLYHEMSGMKARVAATIQVDHAIVKKFHEEFPKHGDEFEARISTTVDTFQNLPVENENFHLFWYVFLNDKADRLMLDGREIDVELLRKIKKQIRETTEEMKRVLIMFFDGCALMRGDLGAIWVELMLSDGNSGVISAETHIRNPQLEKFGWTFWKYILACEETKLIDAIAEAREKFWPKSLLYGVYCDPLNISFVPPPKKEIGKTDKFLDFVQRKSDARAER